MEITNEGVLFTPEYQNLFILLVFFALMALEKYHSHRIHDMKIVRRSYSLNIRIFIFNNLVMSLFSVSSLLLVAESMSEYGLLNFIPSVPLKWFLSFILYDLMLYGFHRARHRYRFLWQFHKVHHSDLDLNTTTSFRLHIAEVLLTTMVKAIFIVVMGVPLPMFAVNELLITSIVMINHANISFYGENALAHIFVVPRMHLVHHSAWWKEHESNFGFSLSFWDKMFDTYQTAEPKNLGLPHMKEPSFWETLFLSFKKNKK